MKTHKWDDVKAARGLSPEKRVELDEQVKNEIVDMITELGEEASGLTLTQLRKKLGLTQVQVAAKMGGRKDQSDVSHMEIRDNHKVSTLRKYIQALGGELEILVRVNGKTIRLRV